MFVSLKEYCNFALYILNQDIIFNKIRVTNSKDKTEDSFTRKTLKTQDKSPQLRALFMCIETL